MKNKFLQTIIMAAMVAAPVWGKVVTADQFPGADAGAKITAAIAAAGDYGVVDARGLSGSQSSADDLVINRRITLLLPMGSLAFAAGKGIRIRASGVSLVGDNPLMSTLVSNGTGGDFISNPDAPTQTYSFTRIEGVSLQAGTAKSSGAALNATNLDQGLVHNVRIMGNWYDVFVHLESRGGVWSYDNIHVPGGVTIHRIWFMQATEGTVSGLGVSNALVANTVTYTRAAAEFDTGVDGVEFTNSQGPGPIIIGNTLHGAMPQYLKFIGTFTEGKLGTYDTVVINDGKDITFDGAYFASAQNAFVITGGQDIKITNCHMVSMKHSALALSGGTRVLFDGNTITDTSQAGNRVYDAISVASGVSDWFVKNNTFRRTAYPNIPRRQISVAPGASDHYQISGNEFGVAGRDFGTAGDAPVSDQGTGRVAVRDYKLY